MATTVSVVSGIASIAGTAYSIYNASQAPSAPSIPPPPTPAGSIQYDSQGNILTQQIWDAGKNAYVTKFDPMPIPDPPDPTFGLAHPEMNPDALASHQAAWNNYWENEYATNGSNPDWLKEGMVNAPLGKDLGTGSYQVPANYVSMVREWEKRKGERERDLQVKTELQAKMLGNLNQTPEDRIKAYDDYAKAFSDQMHRDVDPRFDKYVRATDESLNARGMTGSRAGVDMASETEKNKAFADSDIAQKATLAREDLANSDKSNWLNLYNSLDQGMRADQALLYDKMGAAQGAANAGNASLMARYAAETANANNLYQNDLQRNGALTGALAGLAGSAGSLGMKYLYGQGGSGTAGSGGGFSYTPSSAGNQYSLGATPLTYNSNYMASGYGR